MWPCSCTSERQACRLAYVIDRDPQWVTRSAGITGWVGDQTIDITVGRDAGGRWRLNGCSVEGVAGCSDIDLHFSPLCIKVSMNADDYTPTQPNNVHSRVHIVFPSIGVARSVHSTTAVESQG